MPLRDRAYSWDVSLEDPLHGDNFHNFPSSSMEGGNPKLVIKAKRMSVPVKTETNTSVVIKTEKDNKATTDKKGSSKNGGGSNKKKDIKSESDGQSSKTDSPPKNSGSSSSSTALPMKPPSKPPSHSASNASLRNQNSSSGLSSTIKTEPGIAMDQHSNEYADSNSSAHYSGDDVGFLSYSSDYNDVSDQNFDHSVRNLERILMPDGVRGSMDSTTSSNADSHAANDGPSDAYAVGSNGSSNNNATSSMSIGGGNHNHGGVSNNSNNSSSKPSLGPITGVHSHSLIGASPGGGLDGSGNSSYGHSSLGSSGSSQHQPHTPTSASLLSKGVTSTSLVSYSTDGSGLSGAGASGAAGSSGSSGVMKSSAPLSSVHQHSTNPYSPYTPAVGGLSSGVVSGASAGMGLLGSSSGPGIAGLGNATGMLGLNVGGMHTNTIMPSNNPNGEYRVGAYTREERQLKIEMFRAKKRKRIWRKQIKYDCRKRLADTRPR